MEGAWKRDDARLGLYSDYLDDCAHSVGLECKLQGPQKALCGDLERCEAVKLDRASFCLEGCAFVPAPQYLCDEPDTCSVLNGPQTVQQQLCAKGGVLERFASSCGGSVFRHDSGMAVSAWSFDAEGELTGVVVTSDTAACDRGGYSKVAVYGSPCDATGEGDDPCGSDQQGGASGASGASGSGGAH